MTLNRVKKQLEQAAETISDTAKDIGDKAAYGAREGARTISEMAHDGRHQLEMALYNPLFPEEYVDQEFDMPKMIVIVDEDERENIGACDGAIGWISKHAGLKALHLNEDAVALSGLRFYPMPACDSAYFVDNFDKTRFINLGNYFEVIQKDKMTELANIAHALGARKCELQTYELEKTVSMKKRKAEAKAPKGAAKANGSLDFNSSSTTTAERKILFTQTFEGDATPERPELHWYAHDTEIKRLIDARCTESGRNTTKEYHVEIDNSASSTMSLKMASKIDAALKKFGASCNFSFEGEVQKESRQMLLFDIEF